MDMELFCPSNHVRNRILYMITWRSPYPLLSFKVPSCHASLNEVSPSPLMIEDKYVYI
uniref:Uncharacterized protein n=1 Tax=Picea glauca TaxID=3330 RepID=A0A101M4K3_PICGL|nr:hypothetical protein ABT39_MTgene544 [Picea glauca]